MKDKEKQIEEMARDFKCCYPCEMLNGYEANGELHNCNCEAYNKSENCAIALTVAKCLIGDGYRKIDKDSVVLSKEEYNIIDHNIKHLETVCNNLEQERNRLYEMKLDLENQLIEKGWTDYEGADEIENRVSKETAEKILTKLQPYIGGWVLFKELENEYGIEVKIKE